MNNGSDENIIAKRYLERQSQQGESIPYVVRIQRPLARDQNQVDWECTYEIEGPNDVRRQTIFGGDSMQALVGALLSLGAELQRATQRGEGRFTWNNGRDLGFPSATEPDAPDYIVGKPSPGFTVFPDNGQWVIYEVWTASPAEAADIRAGDRLRSIAGVELPQGIPNPEPDSELAFEWLDARDRARKGIYRAGIGGIISVTIEREGEILEKRITLEPQDILYERDLLHRQLQSRGSASSSQT
jgi:hypothetical protein